MILVRCQAFTCLRVGSKLRYVKMQATNENDFECLVTPAGTCLSFRARFNLGEQSQAPPAPISWAAQRQTISVRAGIFVSQLGD